MAPSTKTCDAYIVITIVCGMVVSPDKSGKISQPNVKSNALAI